MEQSTKRTTWVLVHEKYNELSDLIKKANNILSEWRTTGDAQDEEYYTELEKLVETTKGNQSSNLINLPDTVVSMEEYPIYLSTYSSLCDDVKVLEQKINRGL